jgi:glycosyltransferase involved in cell wall biosynthesis
MTQRALAGLYADLGIPVFCFEDFGCKSPMDLSFVNAMRYSRAIARTAREHRASCIVGVLQTGTFYASLAKDIYCLRLPVIGTILGNLSAYFSSENRKPTLKERLLLRYLLARPSLVITPSVGVARDLGGRFGASLKKIKVVYNGIDISNVRRLAENDQAPQGFSEGCTIITSCRLSSQKDFTTLLKAFREVRQKTEAKLVIVGEGELRERIINEAKELGVDKYVEITGFLKNPFKAIKEADVFVLSSFYEGFGNVIVEAMALGVPVVASDCPSGPAEIINDGVDGLLVRSGDYKAMAGAILGLLFNDEFCKTISEGGLKRAEDFTVENMTKAFSGIIDQLCERRLSVGWSDRGKAI